MYNDGSVRLSLTTKQYNNDALVKHVWSTAPKPRSSELKPTLQQLEDVVQIAPTLHLTVERRSL